MHILWVKMGGLWPATTGGRVRSLQILSALSARHRLTLVTTAGPGDDPAGLAERLPQCHEVVSIPYDVPKRGSVRFATAVARSWLSSHPVDLWKWRVPAVRDEVERIQHEQSIDLCVADFLFATANVRNTGPAPVVLFEHNVEYLIWKRLAALDQRPWRRAAFELEWRKLRRQEARACARAALTIAVSEEDRRRLVEIAPTARTAVIPTGVDTRYFAPSGQAESPRALVFTGSMDWHPNEDAVCYFCDEILPRIRERMPDVSFTIAGRNPSTRVRDLAQRPGIVVTGTVDDVRPHVDAAAVYVVPLRAGSGTRLKIFEALAMAKPVVSTTVGAEGLALTPDREIAIADTPEVFAASVVALLDDSATRRRMGEAGRRLVETRYSWAQIAREFEACTTSVFSERDHAGQTTERRAHLSRA